MCFLIFKLTILLFLGLHDSATLRLDCKTLSACVPFSNGPASSDSFEKISNRTKRHVLVRNYENYAYKTWSDVTQDYKKLKEAYCVERTSSLPSLTDGSDHKLWQLSTNSELSHPYTSNSPLFFEKFHDSAFSSGNHSLPNVVSGTPTALECELEDSLSSSRQSYILNRQQDKFKGMHWNITPRTMQLPPKPSQPNVSPPKIFGEQKEKCSLIDKGSGSNLTKMDAAAEKSAAIDKVNGTSTEKGSVGSEVISQSNLRERLGCIYDKVLVVDSVPAAKAVVCMLTNQYRHMVHACDTEVCFLLDLLLNNFTLDTGQ